MPVPSAPAGPLVTGPHRDGRRWPEWAAPAAIAVAALVAYGRTFSVPFLLDDMAAIGDNPTLRHLATVFSPPADTTVSGRPFLNLSLALNYAAGGTAVWGYHAVNLAIHLAAALTLFGLVRRTLSRTLPAAAQSVAFCSALLWAVHPLQTQAVTYVVQRAESLTALLYLLTLYAFVRAAESLRPHAWLGLSVACCFLGMATKEVMVSAPLIVLLYDRTFLAGTFCEAARRRPLYYGALAASWVLLAALVLSTHGRAGTAGFGSAVRWTDYAVTQASAVLLYLRLAVAPFPLVFDYGSPLLLAPWTVAFSGLTVALLAAATVWALVRRPALGFLGTCFFAILAPSSSVVPVATETIAEHRIYLPLAAVLILAVLGLRRVCGRWLVLTCLILTVGFGVATWMRNQDYRTEIGIWRDTVKHRPDNYRAHNNLGYLLAAEPGQFGAAESEYRRALELKPDYLQALNNLAGLLQTVPGRLVEAIGYYRTAMQVNPQSADTQYNLACALDQWPGHAGEAIARYQAAILLRPDFYAAYFNLGCTLDKVAGQRTAAMEAYNRAIVLKPDAAEAHYNLGFDLQAESGHDAEAAVQYREAIRLMPAYAEAHNNLGSLLQAMPGRAAEAISEYEAAIQANPALVQAHFNLGFELESQPGRLDDAMAQYREAIRLKPDYAEAHFNLGCDLQRVPGRVAEAIGEYREALRLKPGYFAARCNLGNALASAGQTAEALEEYAEALRLQPDNALVHLNRAIILMRVGASPVTVIEELREAVRLDPRNVAARDLLARVTEGSPN